MSKHKGKTIVTPVGAIKYVFIDGEGRNQARPGEEAKMKFVASWVVPENGPEHKAVLAMIDAEWEDYKAKFGAKGKPKSNGIKLETMADPKGEIDPDTEEVRRIPTGNVILQFKTNTTWPDGKPQVVKVFDKDGNDITAAITAAPFSIGNGSTGVIHGTAQGNNVGGDHKVTLYLRAVQLATLDKYEGNEVQAEEIAGEAIDIGEYGVAGIGETPTAEQAPKL